MNRKVDFRLRSNRVVIDTDNAFTLPCAVMWDGDLVVWNTSVEANKGKLLGVLTEEDLRYKTIVTEGIFPTTLPDGDYYANATGQIVNALPVGSFFHQLGYVKGGFFYVYSGGVNPAAVDPANFYGSCC
ncbi:MAG TPA: hypothetical protein VFV37_10915 [Luteibaculaceae bacterium]|nr:hypothetical protein [Luteibaculaceae bacterium]